MHTQFAFINSPQDWIVILLIVMLLFGAKKLPELARGVGKSMGEFKKAREDFEREITTAATEVKTKEPAAKEPHVS
ncbi:MAG: twin-arginine translocase TatA/TatE family subunit [Verrucomicrobia bacterium]|nr:MAG: twin-arginine translocase TatA/TatE family subunit [Verrucomicrobiota bacterium]